MIGEADPLILTARFDDAAAALFQRLRRLHFPAALNIVPAHCTLFHHLPGEQAPGIVAVLRAACAAQAPIPYAVTGPRSLGRGVALAIAAPLLDAMRASLAQAWTAALTPQDRQGFRPHVTVQNKVTPAAARALLERLAAELPPLAGTVVGLDLWHYRGGPWEAAGGFTFDGGEAEAVSLRPCFPHPP